MGSPLGVRRSTVEKIGNGCDQLRGCEWFRDNDAVGDSVSGPISTVCGNIDDWERGGFLSHALSDFPAGQVTSQLYVCHQYTGMRGPAHEQRESFFTGRHDGRVETGVSQHVLKIGLYEIFVLDDEDQRQFRHSSP